MIKLKLKHYCMKKTFLAFIVLLGLSYIIADAQYVRVKPGFNVNVSFGAPGPRPYREVVCVGPEWVWRHGHYVEVPGHWVRRTYGALWVQGRWVYTRRGYRWYNGYWR